MWIDSDREVIESNVFHIPERLREIDPEYFVVYNHSSKQFEVHHKGQIGDTFCLDIPYPELDARTIERVKQTRVERSKSIWEQIKKDMLRMEIEQEISAQKAIDDQVTPKLKEIHRYVSNHESKETIPDDAYTTRFI